MFRKILVSFAAIAIVLATSTVNSLQADLVFSENWLDDEIGATPNNTPDVGLSSSLIDGSFILIDGGGGDRTLRATGSHGFALMYTPLQPTQTLEIDADFVFSINAGSTLAGLNAVYQQLSFEPGNNLFFYWGNDSILRVFDATDTLVSDDFSFSVGQELNVDMFVDLVNDEFSLFINGGNVLTNQAIGVDVNVAPRFILGANTGTNISVDLQHFHMNAAAVPEPSSASLCALAMLGILTVRRRRSR